MTVGFVVVSVQLAGKMLGGLVTREYLVLENLMSVVHVEDLVQEHHGRGVMVIPLVLMEVVHIVLVQQMAVVPFVMGVNRIVLVFWVVLGI